MPTDRSCCIPGCDNRSPFHHFHKFPKDAERRKTWLDYIGDEELKTLSVLQLEYKYICHSHFENKYHGRGCNSLKRTAVPTIFSFVSSDQSDIESLSLDDRHSDGENERASPTWEGDGHFGRVKTEDMLDAADTTAANAEDIDIKAEEYQMLETVEGVNEPLIASAAEEYESMCMEIIGELPEDPPPLQSATVPAKVDTRTQPGQLISLQMSEGDAPGGQGAPTELPTHLAAPDDATDEEYIAAAVINTRHPLGHLAEATEVLVRDHLYGFLDEAALSTDGNSNLPEFSGWSYRDGIFQVRCANSRARDWLAQAVSLVPGERLSVVSVHVPARLVRASIWVSGDVSPVAEIKQRLDYYAARQGIDTTSWRIFQHTSKQKPRGTLLILGMPPEDVALVKEKGRRIRYRLEALKVHFADHESKIPDDEPSPSSRCCHCNRE